MAYGILKGMDDQHIKKVAEPTKPNDRNRGDAKHDAKIYSEQSDYGMCLLVEKEQ
jgi:hypothetical protein